MPFIYKGSVHASYPSGLEDGDRLTYVSWGTLAASGPDVRVMSPNSSYFPHEKAAILDYHNTAQETTVADLQAALIAGKE